MANTSKHKERIFKEIKALPEEVLPKVARLISLIREEFITEEPFLAETDDQTNHKKTSRYRTQQCIKIRYQYMEPFDL